MNKVIPPLGDFTLVNKEKLVYTWTPSKDYSLANDLQVFIDEHMMKPTLTILDDFDYHAIITFRTYRMPKAERMIENITTEFAKVFNNYVYVFDGIKYSLGFKLVVEYFQNSMTYVVQATLKLYWKLP